MFRRTYLVKPALQIKYLLIGLLGIVVTGVCVYLAAETSLGRSESLSQLSLGELASVREAMRFSLLWVMVIVLFVVTVVELFLFHRIFGPLYAVEKVLRMVADGDLTVYMPLRRGDELRDVADAVEQMVGGIRRRVLQDKETIQGVQNALRRLGEANPGQKDELEKLAVRLDAVAQDFRLG
jgi:methyl-accepting chemotaxis protein